MLNRRNFNVACIATSVVGMRAEAAAEAVTKIAALEASVGGRIGVAAHDTRSGKRIVHRGDERFVMCSTFKWLLAAAVLERSDRGTIVVDRRIPYTSADLLPHSPVTRQHLQEGAMSIADLCAAAVEQSDNGAANLMLREIGGPAAVTSYVRSIGDGVTRLDRIEPALNENLPGDPRDTTTPNASVADMERVLAGAALQPRSREELVDWMKNCQTGLDRLRAGLPQSWVIADKTGTGTGSGPTSAANDIAIAWPPQRPPILIASYISGSSAPLKTLSASHAQIGQVVAAAFA